MGNRLLKQGKTEDAIAAYSRAIWECPDIHELEDPTSIKARAAGWLIVLVFWFYMIRGDVRAMLLSTTELQFCREL